MKIQNFGIVLGVLASIQAVSSDKIKESMISDDDDTSTFDFSKILFQAGVHAIYPPKLLIYLDINIREARSMRRFVLPADKNDLKFIQHNLDLRKKMVFIVHGWLSHSRFKYMTHLTEAYLKSEDVIVFMVDWSSGAITTRYERTAKKTIPAVAGQLASFIKAMTKYLGVKSSNIHLIGFSLGGHIVGMVGKNVSNVNRITGLDPAGPSFSSDSLRLSKTDATHVDVVHTSSLLGNSDSLGSIDFYVNGGEHQPGCDIFASRAYQGRAFTASDLNPARFLRNLCSHSRAMYFFIESIENPDCKFVATTTMDRANEVRSKDFDPEQHTVLGLDTFKYKKEGKFYIATNDRRPYCRS